jgi:hypothetical protein
MSKIRIRIAATVAALGIGLGAWLGAMPAGAAAVVPHSPGSCAIANPKDGCTWGAPIK